jgi:hypothetical protein
LNIPKGGNLKCFKIEIKISIFNKWLGPIPNNTELKSIIVRYTEPNNNLITDISLEHFALSKTADEHGSSFWSIIESRFGLRCIHFISLEGKSGFEYRTQLHRQNNSLFGWSYFFAFHPRYLRLITTLL